MNYGDMQTRVALILDNMPSTDPWYSSIGGIINRAGNAFIRMKAAADSSGFELFPELARQTWTLGPTYPIDGVVIVDANTIAQPSDALVVLDVKRAESATAPDWTAIQELPVTYVDWNQFGVLSKDSSVADYIRIFSRKGKTIKVWPSITSAYADYLHFYGIAVENTLSSNSDVFFMNSQWHELVCVLSAHMLAKRMGLYTQAAELLAEVQQEINQTTEVTASEGGNFTVAVHGAPSGGSVYGPFGR